MRPPRLRKRAIAAVAIIVILVSLAGGLAFLVYRPQATLEGDSRLLGLDERGEIVRDAYGPLPPDRTWPPRRGAR